MDMDTDTDVDIAHPSATNRNAIDPNIAENHATKNPNATGNPDTAKKIYLSINL